MANYSLTEETAKRLLRMMRWVESRAAQGASGSVERNTEVPNVQLVRVGSGIGAFDGISAYTSATVVTFNAVSGAIDDLGEVYLTDLNGATPVLGNVYLAVQSGTASLGGNTRTVFTMAQPCCGTVPPANCCDLETIGTVCVTFPYIAIEGSEVTTDPVTVTLSLFSPGIGLTGGKIIANFLGSTIFLLVDLRCIDDVLTLVIDRGGDELRLPMSIISCDPLSAVFVNFPCFGWLISGKPILFCQDITVVGPGACP